MLTGLTRPFQVFRACSVVSQKTGIAASSAKHVATGGHSVAVSPQFFCFPQTLMCTENVVQIHDKNKNLSPLKMYFPPKP